MTRKPSAGEPHGEGACHSRPDRTAGHHGDQRGAGTVLVVMVLMGCLLMLLGLVVVGGYALATHRARGAADLAAVSGATARRGGQHACETVHRVARAQGATVVSCTEAGDTEEFVVAVEVEIRIPQTWPGLPETVRGKADAGVLH